MSSPPVPDPTPSGQQPRSPGGYAYEKSVVTNPIVRIAAFIVGAASFVFGLIVVIVDDEAPWWMVFFALLVAAILCGGLLHAASVSMRLKNGVLEISAGYRSAKIPTGAIGYIGRARFDGRHVRRVSKFNLTNARAGDGVEIVARDGKYVTVRTDTPDELFAALLREGMTPDALKIPFPLEAVSYKRAHEVPREQRTGNGG